MPSPGQRLPSIPPPEDVTPIWRLNMAYLSRGVILTAAELGVFTLLGRRAATATEVCRELEIADRGAGHFLDLLVSLGALAREGERYRNTSLADSYLDTTSPSYLGGFLRSMERRWAALPEALRTGVPQAGPRPSAQEDKQLYTNRHQSSGQWRSFLNGMDYLSSLVVPSIIGALDWGRVGSVLDVGGARGNVAIHLLARFPDLQAAVFDLPPVRELFDDHMVEHGLTGRISFVAGDFFEDELPPTDVVLMTHVLHNWSEPERKSLVAKAMTAVRPGGAVVVCDPMLDESGQSSTASLLASLTMMVATSHGSEYTIGRCRSYLVEAGADDVTVPDSDGHEAVVVGWKSATNSDRMPADVQSAGLAE